MKLPCISYIRATLYRNASHQCESHRITSAARLGPPCRSSTLTSSMQPLYHVIMVITSTQTCGDAYDAAQWTVSCCYIRQPRSIFRSVPTSTMQTIIVCDFQPARQRKLHHYWSLGLPTTSIGVCQTALRPPSVGPLH